MPGSPTTYLYDGQPQADEGRQRDRAWPRAPTGRSSRARARSTRPHHGPVFNSLLGLDLFPWTPATALRDGRRERDQLPLPQPLLRDRPGRRASPSSTRSCTATRASRGSTRSPPTRRARPTTPTSRSSRTCPTRRRRRATRALGRRDLPGAAAAGARRLALDVRLGQRPRRGRARDLRPLAPADAVPRRLRRELQRLLLAVEPRRSRSTGFARIIGDERTERALRTRSGLVMIQQRLAGTDGQPGNRFTLAAAAGHSCSSNRQYAGELWRDELVAFCETQPDADRLERARSTCSAACPVLRGWDLHDNLDSNGALLFRRFATRALAAVGRRPARPGSSTTQFDAGGDPVNTPRGLNIAEPRRRAGARRRGHRPARARASRSTRRCAATSTSAAAASRSRSTAGPGTLGRLQRDQRRVRSPGRATRTCRTARATSTRRSSRDGVPGDALDPHLLAVDQPDARRTSPTRRGCSRDKQWVDEALLREGDRGRPGAGG